MRRCEPSLCCWHGRDFEAEGEADDDLLKELEMVVKKVIDTSALRAAASGCG
ncbi:MAG: hypothetical protein ACLSA6_19365 [Holdemania massiliensis]